jgi:hypothetical protein
VTNVAAAGSTPFGYASMSATEDCAEGAGEPDAGAALVFAGGTALAAAAAGAADEDGAALGAGAVAAPLD